LKAALTLDFSCKFVFSSSFAWIFSSSFWKNWEQGMTKALQYKKKKNQTKSGSIIHHCGK
jgi:hypothetical protein